MLFGRHDDNDDSLRFEGNSLRTTASGVAPDANDWQYKVHHLYHQIQNTHLNSM